MNQKGQAFFNSVRDALSEALFAQKVMSNLVRPLFVEQMVTQLLGAEWRHCGGDWAGWDIEKGGIRIEVKQSAARQTWSDRPSLMKKGEKRFSKGIFDIALRKGYFTDGGTIWVETTKRPAHAYIFAWHGETNETDHRDVCQWRFFVVRTENLPEKRKTISLRDIRSLASEKISTELKAEVDRLTQTAASASPCR